MIEYPSRKKGAIWPTSERSSGEDISIEAESRDDAAKLSEEADLSIDSISRIEREIELHP